MVVCGSQRFSSHSTFLCPRKMLGQEVPIDHVKTGMQSGFHLHGFLFACFFFFLGGGGGGGGGGWEGGRILTHRKSRKSWGDPMSCMSTQVQMSYHSATNMYNSFHIN